MRLRELDRDSIHWGGYSGMRLQVDPFDPLPDSLLGGIPADDFLSQYLENSSNPLASGLGLLVEAGSESDDSVFSAAWSVKDPSSSFYEGVFDLIFSPSGPALPSDAIYSVPRLVEHTMAVRGVQTSSEPDSGIDIGMQVVHQVRYFLIPCNQILFLVFNGENALCFHLHC